MFVVDDILLADEIATGSFYCNLGACKGACCVSGDSGAPLERSELSRLEQALPVTRKYLSPEAIRLVDREGVWEDRGEGRYATRCIDSGECVFVTYEGDVAKCAIQKAFDRGRIDFPKPMSCHLFPIRADDFGTYEVLNYEWAAICDPGRVAGRNSATDVARFLEDPLVRKFGEDWYQSLAAACEERRLALAGLDKNPTIDA